MRLLCGHSRSAGFQKTWLWAISALLALGVLISSVILCLRIGTFTYAKEVDVDIPLTTDPSDEETKDSSFPSANSVGDASEPDSHSHATTSAFDESSFVAKPGFQVEDEQTIWETNTEVELFHVTYSNGEGIVTAVGVHGDRIIAPGTENAYTFRLSNTGNTAMAYHMEMTATFTDGETSFDIPLVLRLRDYTGRYLLGSESEWEPFPQLDTLSEHAWLSAEHYSYYVLDWKWPYESGRDAFDTMLGNHAAGRDLILTVSIRVTAESCSPSESSGGIPPTGEELTWWVYPALFCLAAVLLLLILANRRRNRSFE